MYKKYNKNSVLNQFYKKELNNLDFVITSKGNRITQSLTFYKPKVHRAVRREPNKHVQKILKELNAEIKYASIYNTCSTVNFKCSMNCTMRTTILGTHCVFKFHVSRTKVFIDIPEDISIPELYTRRCPSTVLYELTPTFEGFKNNTTHQIIDTLNDMNFNPTEEERFQYNLITNFDLYKKVYDIANDMHSLQDCTFEKIISVLTKHKEV